MEKQKLKKIVNNIISYSSSTSNLGLLSGRTGAIIFLFHYSKHYGEKIYSDFAGILLDDLFEDIHDRMVMAFDKGLTGIGWGVEYLLKNNFIEGDSYEVLDDIDKTIMNWDVKRMEDETFESGLEGLFHYLLFHLPSIKTMPCPFDFNYILDLDIVASKKIENSENKNLQALISKYIGWRNGVTLNYDPNVLLKRILSFKLEEKDNRESFLSIGLDKGYAGIGLKQMNVLN